MEGGAFRLGCSRQSDLHSWPKLFARAEVPVFLSGQCVSGSAFTMGLCSQTGLGLMYNVRLFWPA